MAREGLRLRAARGRWRPSPCTRGGICVKTPPIMTPPLNSPSALISFEKMKFWRGNFSRET